MFDAFKSNLAWKIIVASRFRKQYSDFGHFNKDGKSL